MNEDSVYLLLEYCTNGPVDQYLQKHERQFRNKFLDHTYDEMLKWSIQISDAMEFLAQNNIIHVSLFQMNFFFKLKMKFKSLEHGHYYFFYKIEKNWK